MHFEWYVISEWQESVAHGSQQVLRRGDSLPHSP